MLMSQNRLKSFNLEINRLTSPAGFSEYTRHVHVYWVRMREEPNQTHILEITLENGKVEFLRIAICWQLKSASLKGQDE